MGSNQHAIAATLANRFDHQFVEIGQNVRHLALLTTQESLNDINDRVLIEIMFDDLRCVSIDSLIIGNPGARRIGNHNIARAIGVHQTGDAKGGIGSKRQGINKGIVDAAINHIHPF